MALARLIRAIAGVVAALIVVAILLKVFSASPHNGIVSDIHDAAGWLVSPFKNVFHVKNSNTSMAVNWGLAVIVYLIVGHLLAALVARSTPRGLRRMRPIV
jgi:hypothetical protein